MLSRTILFLIINFLALGLGGFFTKDGVKSDWYFNLQKAPWTPPGWMFGFAWTTIMICFSIYMAKAYNEIKPTTLLIVLFIIQWILNVAWNPTFFYFNNITLGLFIISLLSILIAYLLFHNWEKMGIYSFLILPYFVWLLIATSLNLYILVKN